MVHVSCVVPPPLKVGGGVGSYGTPSEKGLQVRETLENDTDHAPLLGNYSSLLGNYAPLWVPLNLHGDRNMRYKKIFCEKNSVQTTHRV